MKRISLIAALVALTTALFAGVAFAGPPFINLEGVGGVAFNPLAYPAITPDKDGSHDVVGKPRIGAWYVNLNDADVDWGSIGIADTFFNRVELSYGYESVNLGPKLNALNADLGGLSQNVHKSNYGAKALLLEENSFGTKFIPAVSVGTVYKTTTFNVDKLGDPKTDKSGLDFYLVATKLVTALPTPILLSGGLLSSRGQVNGILGFNDKRDETFFANIDIIPVSSLVVGFEYKQGAKFDAFKNDNYWNAHIGWFVDKNLTLIAAYADAGDRSSTSKVGLGGSTVLSAQYEF